MQMGYAIANHPKFKEIHNTFARENDLPFHIYPSSHDSTHSTPSKSKKVKLEDSVPYHFVAYLPVNGTVYEMDGHARSPQPVGICLLLTSDIRLL